VLDDAFVQQATLTARDQIGNGVLGSAAALSHDGNTALLSGPEDKEGSGAVWVFTRRGSTWTESRVRSSSPATRYFWGSAWRCPAMATSR
jgi:hypothetical protein